MATETYQRENSGKMVQLLVCMPKLILKQLFHIHCGYHLLIPFYY